MLSTTCGLRQGLDVQGQGPVVRGQGLATRITTLKYIKSGGTGNNEAPSELSLGILAVSSRSRF